MDEVIEILKSDYGFKSVTLKQSFEPFGWASVEREDSWDQKLPI